MLKKDTQVRIKYPNGNSDWFPLKEDAEIIGVWTEGRPIKRVECYVIDSDYVPVNAVEIKND